MKLSIETSSYNERRYGKPWIAVVDFKDNKKGNFNFGDWIGQNGHSGILEINVNPGDIVARGQKDTRKPANSAPDFYIVNDMGELGERVTKLDAYKHYLDCESCNITIDSLIEMYVNGEIDSVRAQTKFSLGELFEYFMNELQPTKDDAILFIKRLSR